MRDVGGRLEENRAAQQRAGRVLPPSVCEWVAFAHDVLQDPQADRLFRDVYSVEPVDNGSATSLLLDEEGSGICWGVRNRELDLLDPPVYEYVPDFTDDDSGPATEANEESGSVTEFVLEQIVWGNLRGPGGGFGVEVEDPRPLVRHLNATFPAHTRYKNIDIYETDDIFVQLYWNPNRAVGLEVEVARPLPREAVPAFLWEYAKGGGRFHGMFIPRDLRRV
jgi:hypothetical protein